MDKPNNTRKHHYVAQCLQRKFAVDKDCQRINAFELIIKGNRITVNSPTEVLIETNLQKEDLFTLKYTDSGQQINLENSFCICENLFASNIKKLNNLDLDLKHTEKTHIKPLIKNISTYFLLDYMRNPSRAHQHEKDFDKLPDVIKNYALKTFETFPFSDSTTFHTKLLALAMSHVNNYKNDLGNFLSGTGAWLSSKLYYYSDSTLENGGIALSDLSLLYKQLPPNKAKYMCSISYDKILISCFDLSKLDPTKVSAKQISKPEISLIKNNMEVLANYNRTVIAESHRYVFSDKKHIYGVKHRD